MFEGPLQIKSAIVGTGDVAVGFAPLAEIDFHRILSVIWRGKATILWTTAAALLVAVLLVLVVPHRYTAVTQILIEPTDLHAVGNELTPANQVSDVAVLQIESQARVLASDSVLRRVINTQALDRDPEFAGPPSLLRSLLASIGLGGSAGSADSTLTALTALKRSAQVKRAERTYVVDVSVSSREPEKAARIVNVMMRSARR